MSFWSKKPPVSPPTRELVSMLEEKVVRPLVLDPFSTPMLGRGPMADAIEATLGSYRPDYAEKLRAQIGEAKRACAEAGVDYQTIVSELATAALTQRRKIANATGAELFAMRTAPLPTDCVFYSWQSRAGVESLLQDPEAYWKGIEKSGFFMCENVWNTSGYTGGAPAGEMVEIHIKAGTPFADITPNAVRQALQQSHEYHTSARTREGALKPLNRYNAVDGWWHLPAAGGASFHRFDPSSKPTAALLADLDRIAPSGLPFFIGAVNEALLARGEPASGPLAKPIEDRLTQRLSGGLEELRKEKDPYQSKWLGLAASFVDQGERYPALRSAVLRDLSGMSDAELHLHARFLMSYAPDEYPPPAGMKALAGQIRAEALRRGLDATTAEVDAALTELDRPPAPRRR